MDIDAFELFKHSARGNMLDWIKNLLIIEYGEIIQVVDVNTVKAKLLVQEGQISKVYIVRIIHVGSSRLVEDTVQPQVGDQVLLLFLRSHDDLMFLDPVARAAKDPDGVSTINNASGDMNRYNMFSGVGILAGIAKTRAPIQKHVGVDADGAYIAQQIGARVMSAFKEAVTLVFDSPRVDAETHGPEAAIKLLFGRQSPVSLEHRSSVNVKMSGPNSALVIDTDADIDVRSQADVDVELDGTFYVGKTGSKQVARNGDDAQVTDTTDPANMAGLEAVCSIFGIPFAGPLKGKITSGSSKLKAGD